MIFMFIGSNICTIPGHKPIVDLEFKVTDPYRHTDKVNQEDTLEEQKFYMNETRINNSSERRTESEIENNNSQYIMAG